MFYNFAQQNSERDLISNDTICSTLIIEESTEELAFKRLNALLKGIDTLDYWKLTKTYDINKYENNPYNFKYSLYRNEPEELKEKFPKLKMRFSKIVGVPMMLNVSVNGIKHIEEICKINVAVDGRWTKPEYRVYYLNGKIFEF